MAEPPRTSGVPGGSAWWDKVPPEFSGWGEAEFVQAGLRAVPGAVVRYSAYVAPGAVLMPCFVNVGAHIGAGTMIDTWSTVGSCAQVGQDCHISGGVGIAGVLEPLQDQPVIIEDQCFIGARSEIAEGVVVPGSLGGGRLEDGTSRPGLYCAVIIKQVDERTRAKTSINDLLRD